MKGLHTMDQASTRAVPTTHTVALAASFDYLLAARKMGECRDMRKQVSTPLQCDKNCVIFRVPSQLHAAHCASLGQLETHM